MKTLVLSFRKRTDNPRFSSLDDFIKLLNAYTLYADHVLSIDCADEKAFVESIKGDSDCVFILNAGLSTFNLGNLLLQSGFSADANGFCYANKLISIVPDDFNKGYEEELQRALNKQFGTCVQKVTFKLYGLTNQEITQVTDELTDKYQGVYFDTQTENLDSLTTLIYGQRAPKSTVDGAIREFILQLKDSIYAQDDISLEQRLNDVLKLRRIVLCTAESMTGGRIASRLVETSGASDVFYEGLVTYNTLSKERRLEVSHATVNEFSVVSSQVAFEMARGLLSQGNCNMALTITGYAGSTVSPSDSDGLCFIAVGTPKGVSVYKYKFNGDRKSNINSATNAALFLAVKTAENNDSF